MNGALFSELWMMPAVVAVIALLLYLFGNSLLKKYLDRIRTSIIGSGVPLGLLILPIRLLFLLIAVAGVIHYAKVSAELKELMIHVLSIGSIIGVSWFILRMFAVVEGVIQQRYKEADKGNMEARRVATNVSLVRKIMNVLVIVLAISGVLMTFDTVRQIGVSILASAGLAGIVIGFAAQRSLQTLIAGIQIAISQPVRLDDIVVVENETGKVEEITLTYVVVCLWDQRHIIVPITWFIDKPFQNLTRSSSELTGAVMFNVSYSAPIELIRKELEKIITSSPLWDKRLVRLEVTNAAVGFVELRALVSAASPAELWALR
ncbi:MAG: mechanosensitive ion channel, partial [Chlorobiaceae bacterium]|nr:mechanosensitive ion channel [Chlorobiaceae bacterium]